jgi:hypothetical protein
MTGLPTAGSVIAVVVTVVYALVPATPAAPALPGISTGKGVTGQLIPKGTGIIIQKSLVTLLLFQSAPTVLTRGERYC